MLNSSHLSAKRLLYYLDGELPPDQARRIQSHLGECPRCLETYRQLQQASERFDGDYSRLDPAPPMDPVRVPFLARLAELDSSAQTHSGFRFAQIPPAWAAAAALAGLVAVGLIFSRFLAERPHFGRPLPAVWMPNSRLTPGATLLVSRQAVCSQENVKNKSVPIALQRLVFAKYGMPEAEPRGYELDYLVTPALGGADDIHNVWPQSYSSVWNAHVKDALEDKLRDLVCDGGLELSQAQHEIAEDWVAAYRKYFHTELPLAEHVKAKTEVQ